MITFLFGYLSCCFHFQVFFFYFPKERLSFLPSFILFLGVGVVRGGGRGRRGGGGGGEPESCRAGSSSPCLFFPALRWCTHRAVLQQETRAKQRCTCFRKGDDSRVRNLAFLSAWGQTARQRSPVDEFTDTANKSRGHPLSGNVYQHWAVVSQHGFGIVKTRRDKFMTTGQDFIFSSRPAFLLFGMAVWVSLSAHVRTRTYTDVRAPLAARAHKHYSQVTHARARIHTPSTCNLHSQAACTVTRPHAHTVTHVRVHTPTHTHDSHAHTCTYYTH